MASQSLPIQVEEQPQRQESGVRGQHLTASALVAESWLLVAGFADAVAADYGAYVCRLGNQNVAIMVDDAVHRHGEAPGLAFPLDGISQVAAKIINTRGRCDGLILFLNSRLTARDRQSLHEIFGFADQCQIKFVGIVSTFRATLGDQNATEAEAYALERAKGLRARTVVFRPGHVLSRNSRATAHLRRFGFLYPLVPSRLRSCFVDGDELFAAIEDQRRTTGPRGSRLFIMLGPNRSWRALLARHAMTSLWRAGLTAVSALLSLLLFGHIASLALDLLARRRPALRCWNFGTLCPQSFRELLALCNKYNWRHVKVVGYNNGVNHFGKRYAGKTIVSAVNCNRALLKKGAGAAGGFAAFLKADCGTTIHKAREVLARSGLQMPVMPNYSYVCLGTAFFIPIHGSASDFSTVADTITRVLLYDPLLDRFITATRDEPAFCDHVYNLRADILLLRLHLLVKPKSQFYVRKDVVKNASGAELLDALRDFRATNVEIRKSSARSDTVTVSRYYQDSGVSPCPALELPRDTLGSLWDRLEENSVTSFLMHALTRHFAYHLELFFTAADFAQFWETHRPLPLRKLQLRYIRRDGLPHSPFREHDCVSVDLFMLRRHRRRFQAYLKCNFPGVRSNPGKQSR
jgi:hypothetical protein